MAHLVLTIDPDPSRRQRFQERASARLSSWPGLVVERAEVGELAVAWGRGASAPHCFCVQEDGLGFVLGHAIDDAGAWMDGRAVMERWFNPATRGAVFDGYHLAGAYSRNDGLVLGVDPLGLFPLYQTECGGVLIAGTSPELFSAHPEFRAELDLRGLTGILLANGLVSGRALLRGVRRVGVGCQLRWSAGQETREVETWQLTPHDRFSHHTAETLLEAADEEIRRAIRRHRPRQGCTTLMLSGGLDSRLMAGYLKSEGAIKEAVCLGRPSDFEMRAAFAVCRALNLPLRAETQEPDEAEFVQLSRRVAHWEHLAGGFGGATVEASGRLVGRAAPMFWSGYVVEDIVGGVASRFGRDPATGEWSFETFFRTINAWGWPPKTLERLLRPPECRQFVQEHVESLRQEYARPGETPAQQAFRVKLANRTRFHIGVVPHRLCINTWPLLPILDRRVLDLHFNAPAHLLVGRRLERDLLIRRFPHLADIPMDTNSFRFEPLRGTVPAQVSPVWRTVETARKNVRRWYWRHWRRSEPRRYHRQYDFDSPDWRAVRLAAEPFRARVAEWLDRDILNEVLPPPHVTLGFRDPFAEASGRRALLGLLLWTSPRE